MPAASRLAVGPENQRRSSVAVAGSTSPSRVRRAGAEQLLEWGERLVTTGSLEEVLGRDHDD